MNQQRALNNEQLNMILFSAFEKRNLSFTDIQSQTPQKGKDVEQRNKNQLISFPQYNYGTKENPKLDQFRFQTPSIKITSYGVPPLSNGQSDESRTYLRIPIDPEQEKCLQLEKMLETLDNQVQTKSKDVQHERKDGAKFFFFRDKKVNESYEYTPVIRIPIVDDDIELNEPTEKKVSRPKTKYFKVKMHTEFPSNKILTKVFVGKELKHIETMNSSCPYRTSEF